MKKRLFNIALWITLIFSCFSLFSCEKEGEERKIRTCYTVGTFSGYRVDLIQFTDVDGLCVVKEYYVDDVYISSLCDTTYTYILYTSETEYVNLKKAYEQGLITHDDLLAIAEAEAPRDNLKQDDFTVIRTVGTFSGYRVDLIQFTDAEGLCVETPYYVDDVYIFTLCDTTYTYILYTSETEYVELKVAYEQGLIAHDDLLAIAEAEEPRDNLKQDNGDQV